MKLGAALLAWLPLLPAQTPLTAEAIGSLQDEGRLDARTAAAGLMAGGDVARATAAILRHEWPELPAKLLDLIEPDSPATETLLRELALAPRPSVASWAQRQVAREGLPIDARCYALAATGQPLRGSAADLLVGAAADGSGGDGYRTAAWLLDSKSADRLIGRLHAALLRESTDFSRLLPFFDRLSPAGYEQLIGLVVSLPPARRAPLVRYYLQNDVPAFERRAADALDGKIELEPIWLARAERLLDERPRVERLLGVLRDPDSAPALQEAAFRALVGARVLERDVLDWVESSAGRLVNVRKVLDAGVTELPARQLVAWLRDDVAIAKVTAAALFRRPRLEPEIEATLLELLGDVTVQVPSQPFAMALLHGGSVEAVTGIWPQLRKSELFGTFVDALARRRAPWGHALLLAELESDAQGGATGEPTKERREQLDAVRLALVTLGDRRQLEALVARARSAEPTFVRRCARRVSPLEAKYGLRLLEDAAALADDDLAVELIGWAAATRDPAVERELQRLWQSAEFGERQLAALHGLAAGDNRPRLVDSLRTGVAAGALDDRYEALCYELIATMPTPLTRPDVELLAELALWMPLFDPARERARAERWPDGRFGFPLAAAVAHRLRGGDPELAHAAFSAAAERVRSHADFAAFAPQRLVVIWRALVPDPSMQTAIGRATASLLLATSNPEGVGTGPAHLFALDQAERDGDLERALAHATAAVARLLRRPSERTDTRLFLGERDPAAGKDPWSALAARVYLLRARIAIAASDRPDAAKELAVARDLAGHDLGITKAIAALSRSESSTKGKQ